jgi:hypothetical protein
MFDFPASPSIGTTFTPAGGPSYVWDGNKWKTGTPLPGVFSIVQQVFLANGTYTPTSGMLYCIAEGIGSGAGGGGCAGTVGTANGGGGGAAATYVRSRFTAAQIGASKAVVVGASVAGGAAGNNDGNAGSNTTLGATLLVAPGGAAGGTGVSGAGNLGSGGLATNTGAIGDFVVTGGDGGMAGLSGGTVQQLPSGFGGASYFGGGARGRLPGANAAVVGQAGRAYGSGGGGACFHNVAASQAGGASAPGALIITEYVVK